MVEKKKKAPAKQEQTASTRGRMKEREGLVVSDKMEKTVIVAVVRQVKHPTYGKYVRRTSRYVAHDEKEQCNPGDLVLIVETRPMSATKRWRVEKIVRRAEQ